MANVTITIPAAQAHSSPNVIVTINGIEYAVPVGQEVSIPEEVAAEIQRMLGHVPLPETEESGGGGGGESGGVFVVGVTMEADALTLDKSWREIHDAMQTSMVIIAFETAEGRYCFPVTQAWFTDGNGYVRILDGAENMDFITDHEDGYPSAASD